MYTWISNPIRRYYLLGKYIDNVESLLKLLESICLCLYESFNNFDDFWQFLNSPWGACWNKTSCSIINQPSRELEKAQAAQWSTFTLHRLCETCSQVRVKNTLVLTNFKNISKYFFVLELSCFTWLQFYAYQVRKTHIEEQYYIKTISKRMIRSDFEYRGSEVLWNLKNIFVANPFKRKKIKYFTQRHQKDLDP